MMVFDKWMGALKSKLKAKMRSRGSYGKVEKTESMRLEIRSRRAQRLIVQTLKTVDESPRHKLPLAL